MKNLLILTLILGLVACNTSNEEGGAAISSDQGDYITVPENSSLAKKLLTKEISDEPFRSEIATFGIVRAIPNNYAEIASPFAGRITKSFIRLGQDVAVDEPVFEISSPSFFEASKLYYQAKQEMALADKNHNRQHDLFDNGVGVEKDLEEAEVKLELSKRDLENAIASLHVYKVNPEKLVLGQALIIRSPIAGEIVTNNIVIGQYLKEDADPIAVVAELSKVWIVAQIKEKDISSINESKDIEISIDALSHKIIKGSIYHISEILDEETRSIQVYIECDNTEGLLKPGMYASVTFRDEAESSILIAATSVFQDDKECFVFVRQGNDKYVKRVVDITGASNGRMLLKSGIEVGDVIVSEGGYYLLDFN